MGRLIQWTLCTLLAGAAFATAAQPASTVARPAQIPAQPLIQALNAFTAQTGLQLMYVSDVAEGRESKGSPAGLSPAETLAHLLEGTGLTFEFLNERTVAIRGPATSAASLRISDATVHVDIPADDLDRALRDFGVQSGLTVVAPTALTAGKKGAAVRGDFTATDALGRLLIGSGLTFARAADDTIAIQAITSNGPVQASAVESGLDKDLTQSAKLDEVVVTGTHITGVTPVSQVITITRKDIEASGYTSTSQLINSLPQNFNGGSAQAQVLGAQGPQANEFSATVGTSTPSLRGLGDATLTLVDGHRLSSTGGSNGSDISSVPLAAIERVDVLTDGASSIYGADAIAGVINVILRKNYDGAEVSVSVSDPTRHGGGQQQTYSLTAGTHWATGNTLVSYTGQNQDPLFSSQRDFSAAALSPITLIPPTHSNAFTLYLNQNVAPGASVYADLLYNDRTASSTLTFPFGSFFSPAQSKQYSLNAGSSIKAGSDWTVGMDVNVSRDKEAQQTIGFGSVLQEQTTIDEEKSIELHADGPILSIYSGVVKGALGVGVRSSSFDEINPAISPISGGRRNRYIYGELQAPLISPDVSRLGLTSLDLSVSGRVDRYSDVGTSSNPKIGLVYGFSDEFHLRGSYGRSFRAPKLVSLYSPASGFLFTGSDPSFAGGTAVALFESGGNPALRPETSRSWSVTVDYKPAVVQGLSVTGTYFSYKFTDKILPPTENPMVLPLNDPSISPFTTLFPAMGQIQVAANSLVPPIENASDTPNATLADVQAILNGRDTNISTWTSRGVDLLAAYAMDVHRGTVNFQFNASRLDVKDQPIPSVMFIRLSDVIFGPPKLRLRTGVTWDWGAWSATGFVNYVSGEADASTIPSVRVGSFTTTDLQVAYSTEKISVPLLSGLRVSLSASNVFDRNPPMVQTNTTGFPGIGYDSANASPYGRVIAVQATKKF